ncbi:response regulator [Chroococcidiopsis sp. FACHB-1243]|uniref:ATP-binding protein n=1 Tax=Chroococcidiopsis sp. [FACHB-1243] TaxID=2692781 RepID=UPI001784B491|nr:ATP-binding protein [Chroococcidiopsis sp. [FACHB-1243]]MBD2309371.1 response regulator [Chroococcidiopsis sp. [FACHB-1243]]
MQRPQREITLNNILITEELSRRSPRPPNLLLENQALHTLARQLVNQPEAMLQSLVDIALDLCNAGTAGVSLLEVLPSGEEVFRWNVLAGRLSQYVGGTTPRNFSPCGTCLERGTPQLFSHPERYFTYFQKANTPVVEGLVLPLIAENHALGTIWIMSHDEQRHFDSEDVRVMTSLADFTAAALLRNQRQTKELLAANATLEAEIVERLQAEEKSREIQRRLELSLTGANLGVWTYNVGTDEFWADDRAKRMHGHEPHEVHNFEESGANIHPEDRDRAGMAFAQAIQERSKLQIEYRVVWRDGSVRWIASYAEFMPLGDRDEGIFYGVAQDISDRKRAELALRESEGKYRSLFNSIDEGFCIIERVAGEPINFRYVEANPAFAVQTGVSDIVGKTIREAFPNAQETGYENYENVLKTGEPLRFETNVSSLERTLEIYAFRIEGEPRLAVIFKDISDRKRHDANLVFLAEVSQDLARLTNIDETMNALGEKIGGHLDLSACAFAELDEAAEIGVINHSWHRSDVPSLAGTYRMEEFVTPDILQRCRAGEAVVVRDVFDDPLTDGEQYAALNIGSFLSIPLVRNGEWRFLLVIYHTEPYDWRDDEIELTRELANRIWTRLERARAEVGLRRSEEKYRLLFNSIDEGYALCELLYDDDERAIDWKILQVNPAFESLTGLRDVAGKNATQLDRPLNQNWLQTFGTVAQTGESTRFEHYIDSVDYWFEILVSRIDEDKHHIVVVFNNITDRKQAEADRVRLIQEQAARQQERQRAETLANLDRAKTLFFSNVSHEFRTPLTLLLAPLQDALSDAEGGMLFDHTTQTRSDHRTYPLSSSQRERLELAHRNANRLLKLVNTLLDFSRIEAGRIEAVYEPTDLAAYTTELASVFRSAIERAGLRLIVDCPPLPQPVYVDREMWEKIVLNLLSNAFKFTLEGEIAVRLHSAQGECVILQIQDTGTGIPHEDLPHLFERFYQVRGVTARTHEGSGIGLALVQELIRMHGATVDVSSVVGQGTCFTVTIPLGTAHLPSDLLRLDVGDRNTTRTLASTALGAALYVEEVERWLPEEGSRESEVGSRDKSPTHHAPLTTHHSPCILLVDDNADMRDYLTRILSDRFQVEAVADGAAALAVARARVPDLVLSDVMMPQLDGFGLLQALRANPQTRETPIILLSARVGEESVVSGLEAGADDYLIKPFSAAELVSRVNAHLQMAQLRSEALRSERTINRRKDELLSTVSHELNTPLVAILGWTRLLRASPPSQSMLTKSLETIERNATLQAKLIQDLLDISRIEAGKLRLSLEPIELKSVIEVAIAAVKTAAIAKGIHIEWKRSSVQEASEITISGDRDRLQQVICNLLTNAIKFTPQGGTVEISLTRVESRGKRAGGAEGEITTPDSRLPTPNSYAQIQIKDTGIGISPDFLPHVFDRFRQAEGENSAKGLGLGLAIARHLVELHNGTIHAESLGVGQGATFTVGLPIFQKL